MRLPISPPSQSQARYCSLLVKIMPHESAPRCLASLSFEKLRALLADAGKPTHDLPPINLSIGEPKHAAPACVGQAIAANLAGLSVYPSTKGEPALRQAISQWLSRPLQHSRARSRERSAAGAGLARGVVRLRPDRHRSLGRRAGGVSQSVLPDLRGRGPAGRRHPYYVNADPARDFGYDWARVPDEVWRRTQLVFVCSPGNPAGNVMSLEEWRTLFELSDRHGFVIAADECYSEIYLDEDNPRWAACRRRAAWGAIATRTWWRSPACQAFERARHAFGVRGRRRRAAGALPAVPHLPWQRHEPGCFGRQHRCVVR